jgi:hypothetical protein
MRHLILACTVVLMAGSAAFAQSSQGQAAGQAGVNGNAANAPENLRNNETSAGTVGRSTDSSRAGSNGSPVSTPRAQDSPGRSPESRTAPK